MSVLHDFALTKSDSSTHRLKIDWITVSLVAIGAGLRIFQYLLRSSLWGDELAVVDNVLAKGPLYLITHPLDGGQMAPAGFLLCLKAMIALAGSSEYSLRFIAIVSSIAAIFLFVRFSREWLSRPAALLALAAFACSPALIMHCAEVKPYSSDVAFCMLCPLAACSWMNSDSRRSAIWLAAIGAVVMWFSYPVVFVLGSIGLVALIRCGLKPSSDRIRQTILVLGTWLVSAGALALLEIHRTSKDTHAFMLAFWAQWLFPDIVNAHTVTDYVVRLARDCFSLLLRLRTWWIFAVLFLFGAIYLLRRAQTAWLLVLPFLAAVTASMVRAYPFSGRLILFLVPSIYVLIAGGLQAIVFSLFGLGISAKWRTPLFSAAVAVAAIGLCVLPLRWAHPPFHNAETRPLIAYLGEHWRAGDAICVHKMAWRAYNFYGPGVGLQPEQAVKTSPSRKLGPDPLVVLRDLDQFRGRPRVWILFGATEPVEATCAKAYLDSIGTELDYQSTFAASLYLYDLRAGGRPMPAGADEFFNRSRSSPACSFDSTNVIRPQT